MFTAAIAGFLCGALLGLISRLSLFVVASAGILVATFAHGVSQDQSAGFITLAMALNLVALQSGYLGVLVIRFVRDLRRERDANLALCARRDYGAAREGQSGLPPVSL